jgi:XK-related protein
VVCEKQKERKTVLIWKSGGIGKDKTRSTHTIHRSTEKQCSFICIVWISELPRVLQVKQEKSLIPHARTQLHSIDSKIKNSFTFVAAAMEFLPLCDVLFNIISLALYFCDLVFDVVLGYALYERGRTTYFTVVVVLVSTSLIVSQVKYRILFI